MNKVKSLSLRIKLMLCISFLSGVTLLVGIIGIDKLNELAERSEVIYNDALLPNVYLADISQSLTSIHAFYLHIAYGGQAPNLTSLKEKTEVQAQLIEQYATCQMTEENKVHFAEMKAYIEQYNTAVYNEVARIQSVGGKSTQGTMEQIISIVEKAQTSLNVLIEDASQTAAQIANKNRSSATGAVRAVYVVAIFGIFISFLIVAYVIRAITMQIRDILNAVSKVSEGKLDVKLESKSSAKELALLAQYVNKMIDNLQSVVTNIEAASEQVHVGAQQVAHTSSLLAQGATDQASTIEELTAAVEQINAQIKLNAEHAKTMNHIAGNTKGLVEKSHTEMDQMLHAMEDINYSSNEISKIIKVIDDIAFQTNILALNAAVEAARAGQHGKGFTVVAEEVRNLAAKSAEAAKETTGMIENCIQNTQSGMSIAQSAAKQLGEVVVGINEVAELTAEISASCSEQTLGITQINESAVQISNVIQNNSATSEEAAAASEELAGQAEVMRGEVSRFQVNANVYSNASMYIQSRKNEHMVARENLAMSDNDFGKY